MAKKKGIKVLNKVVTKELANFGIKKAVCGDEYSYDYEKKVVTFKESENGIEDKWFTEFVKERFNYDVRYPFIISLLHEIGHNKANDDVIGEVYDFCFAEKERIMYETLATDDENEMKKLSWQYFNLPDEIMATKWAVDYARKHPKKIKKMWKKTRKALLEFYEKNGFIADLMK